MLVIYNSELNKYQYVNEDEVSHVGDIDKFHGMPVRVVTKRTQKKDLEECINSNEFLFKQLEEKYKMTNVDKAKLDNQQKCLKQLVKKYKGFYE